MRKKVVALFAVIALALGMVAATAAPAMASGCRIQSLSWAGHTTHSGSLVWGYSPIYTKPAPGCNDIQVRNMHDLSGGSTWTTVQIEWLTPSGAHTGWGTAYNVILDQSPWKIVATGVIAGTKYRVWNQDDGYLYSGQVMD
jgi:hypothetical protein